MSVFNKHRKLQLFFVVRRKQCTVSGRGGVCFIIAVAEYDVLFFNMSSHATKLDIIFCYRNIPASFGMKKLSAMKINFNEKIYQELNSRVRF
jgi:hypothetical protein